jgi:uncharacterized protein
MIQFVRRTWLAWFGETVKQVEADAERFRTSEAGKQTDTKTIWVLVLAALSLTGQNFWQDFVPLYDLSVRFDLPYELLYRLAFAVGCLFWYCVPAMLLIRSGFGETVREYGVKLTGWTSGWKIYLVFVAIMVPVVIVMSAEPHFQKTYPFYRWVPEHGWKKLLVWELAYAVQFLALEFFFRGFMVHGLKHRFGVYSVCVMTVPYCMIHFGKPLPECLASVIAGLMLGLMSLKTRSVWLGAALHVSVAWGMDFCALVRSGLLSLS